MEPGFPEGFDDGCCMATVAVRADAAAVASVLGGAVPLCRGGVVEAGALPDATTAFVLQRPGQAWSLVDLEESVFDPQRDTLDSDPLLRQARAALNGQVPVEPREGHETPVTTAARLAAALGVPAVGLWGSDQGPGILGAAFFDGRTLTRVLSAASPALIDRIAAMRQTDASDDLVSEVLDAVEAYCEDQVCEFTPATGALDVGGPAYALLDEAFRAQGIVAADEPLASWGDDLCRRGPGARVDDVDALFAVA